LTDTDASQNGSDRLCPQSSLIPTDSPEVEAWHRIDQLTSLSYVHSLLDNHLNSIFFEKLRQNIEALNRRKQELNNRQNNHNKRLDVFEILSPSSGIISQNAAEITLLARQAIEFYKASQQISLHAKPILLYYSYICLTRILFLNTYEAIDGIIGHGFKLDNNEDFTVLRNGSFQRFHDSYSWDPSIYLNACKFSWRDLIIGNTDRYNIVLNMGNCNEIYLHGVSKNDQYSEHELTREIMFTYAMSMLARYRVQYWNQLIEGKREGIIWKITEYLTSTQTLFPNLIYNQLEGKQYYFYPVGHELFELPVGRPQQLPWML